MNQTENDFPSTIDVVAEAIALKKKAEESSDKAIAKLLAQRDEIEHNLKLLGHIPVNGNNGKHAIAGTKIQAGPTTSHVKGKRFKKMTLAEVGRIILGEHGTLHGTKIEELAKAGGYKGGTEKFQNYLAIALKRDGGFENTGKNTWKLKGEAKK